MLNITRLTTHLTFTETKSIKKDHCIQSRDIENDLYVSIYILFCIKKDCSSFPA